MKRKVSMARMVRINDADRSFDLEFWEKVGSEGRFAAAWQMVFEADAIRGKNVSQPRLQRSVQNLERLRG